MRPNCLLQSSAVPTLPERFGAGHPVPRLKLPGRPSLAVESPSPSPALASPSSSFPSSIPSPIPSPLLSPPLLRLLSLLVASSLALLPAAPAHAQLGDLLKQGSNALGKGGNDHDNSENKNAGNGNASSSGLGNLGGAGALGGLGAGLGGALGGKSIASGSMGNVAGLLEFCIKNNYLGSGAGSVKDQLLSKLGGGQKAKSDTGYQAGGMGLLKGSDGKQIDLSGGGLKEKITRQVCDKVLSQGKSFL